jgi:hypothetical protein
MNRREFSLASLKAAAVGAMASMGCAGKVAPQFKIGDFVLVRRSRPDRPERIPAIIEAIEVTTRRDRVDVMYECKSVAWLPGFNRELYSASLLELMS